jgi:hypothetical protein
VNQTIRHFHRPAAVPEFRNDPSLPQVLRPLGVYVRPEEWTTGAQSPLSRHFGSDDVSVKCLYGLRLELD